MLWAPFAIAQSMDDVAFSAEYSRADLGWDSGWYPPGDPEPGAATIQVRLLYGAAARVDADIQGEYELNGDLLSPGAAGGEWGYDFGAEVLMKIAFNINFTIPNPLPFGDDFIIEPFVIDVPYVPNFDLRTTQSTTVDSYLLDEVSELADSTQPVTVYSLDLVDLILGWLDPPQWVRNIMIINAGAALDVAIETSARLSCDDMTLSDGTVFTDEGQQEQVDISVDPYTATAAYNENFEWDLVLNNAPSVFIEIKVLG
ncbi:MAG TPA: hypothetical protein ENN65_07025, partial [Candidatus Hydrogenedentes bacterium]|nr:hypothetical protein [Candidatus Hydrogenedentota bacterium]